MVDKLSTLTHILDGLMSRYKQRVPNVSAVIDLLVNHQIIKDATEIENDHIAFRTIGVPHLGVQSLEKIFLHYGYTKREHYYFDQKNLMPGGMHRLHPSIPVYSSVSCV